MVGSNSRRYYSSVSAEERFYKQEYCGCSYSLRDSNLWRKTQVGRYQEQRSRVRPTESSRMYMPIFSDVLLSLFTSKLVFAACSTQIKSFPLDVRAFQPMFVPFNRAFRPMH